MTLISGIAAVLGRAALAVSLAAAIGGLVALRAQVDAVARYEVDTTWPKPLPDRWVLGGLGGICTDSRDHLLILNRQDVLDGDLNAGYLAPPIIELDQAGAVVHSWGDAKLLDPRLHSCFFDQDDNVWIASAPSGMVQKYSHDGRTLLLQVGKKGAVDSSDGTPKGTPLNSSAAVFFMPSSLFVDPANGDLYVSDGEGRNGNRRIAVVDRAGRFLRQWQPEGMQTVHCMAVARDGLVYVCNREASRIQVYDKAGTFIRNIDVPWRPLTPRADGQLKESGGSAVSVTLSPDPAQSQLFLINQNNAQIEIIDRRSGKVLSHFGGGIGHYPGQFDQPHGIAIDSKRNVYVAENRGKRVQRFKPVN